MSLFRFIVIVNWFTALIRFAECTMSVPFSFHAVSKVRENLEKGDGFTHGNAKPTPPKQDAWFSGQGECDDVASVSGLLLEIMYAITRQHNVRVYLHTRTLEMHNAL